MLMKDISKNKWYKVKLNRKKKSFQILKKEYNKKSEGQETIKNKTLYKMCKFSHLEKLINEDWTEYIKKETDAKTNITDCKTTIKKEENETEEKIEIIENKNDLLLNNCKEFAVALESLLWEMGRLGRFIGSPRVDKLFDMFLGDLIEKKYTNGGFFDIKILNKDIRFEFAGFDILSVYYRENTDITSLVLNSNTEILQNKFQHIYNPILNFTDKIMSIIEDIHTFQEETQNYIETVACDDGEVKDSDLKMIVKDKLFLKYNSIEDKIQIIEKLNSTNKEVVFAKYVTWDDR